MSGYRLTKKLEENQPTRYYSKRQETSVAKELGAMVTKNSGATMWDKGDLSLSNDSTSFLIECKTKTTDSDSISIKKEWLEKLKNESLFMGKNNEALIFDFGPNSKKKYVIIDLELFKRVIDALDDEV